MQSIFKSFFIAIFPVFALYIAVSSGLNLAESEFSYQYFGTFVSSITVVAFFVGLFIVSQARTSKNLIVYSILISIGLLITISGIFLDSHSFNTIIVLNGILIIICWIAYLKWFSVFNKRDSQLLKPGKILPEFDLEDSNHNKISSSSFKGNPSIFLFYRGNWCPLCLAQIKEIALQYKALEQRGVNMVMVSPQPHNFSESLAKKYDLGFHFLTDINNTAAKQLNIFAKNGIPAGFQVLGYSSDTVMPTVIITDAKGQIVFADLTDNYRVRPEPETFIKVIDELN